jgi:AbrB family looped-hinge helix DNA binding protein
MEAFDKAVKISSKGQITLPKPVRDLLGADVVRIVVVDGHVHIVPVVSVAGVFAEAGKRTGYVPIEEAKKIAWQKHVEEKFGNR